MTVVDSMELETAAVDFIEKWNKGLTGPRLVGSRPVSRRPRRISVDGSFQAVRSEPAVIRFIESKAMKINKQDENQDFI
jgi:hypothetical protein